MGATDRFSLIVESATRGESELRRFEETMNRVADVVERSQRRTSNASQKAAQDTSKALQQAQSEAAAAGDSMAASAVKFGAAAAAIAAVGATMKAATVDAAFLAARTNTLTVVTQQLASANNLYSQGVLTQARAVKQQGIFTGDALAVVNRMIFAQLDLAKATDLARVSQDAAVIAGINSSEALEGIIHGIVTRQPEVLRTYGIVVNFEQEYSKAARKLGRDLTDTEKTQIAMNRVLQEGGKIAGAYEAAMGTAGKQVSSLKRYVDEASNAIGSRFENEVSAVVRLLADSAKFAENNADAFALLAKSTVALTAATSAYIAVRSAVNAVESGAAAGVLAKIAAGSASMAAPVGLVAGAGIGAAFATMQQLSELEDAYKRTFDEPRLAAAKLNQEIAKIIVGLKDGTASSGQFREALTRALRAEAEGGRSRRLLPEYEGLEKMDAQKAGSIDNPEFLKYLKSRGLQDVVPLLAQGGTVATFARQQLGRQFLDENYSGNPTGIKVIRPPSAAELEAQQAEYAKKAKAIEDNVRDFVMRSFDSGLDALDRITIQTVKIWEEAVTPGQRARIEAASRRMYDSTLSDQSAKLFGKSSSRVTGLELEAQDAVRRLEDPNRGVPIFVARPSDAGGAMVQRPDGTAEMMTPERLDAYGKGLVASSMDRDKQRLSLIQQMVEFESRKAQLLAGPGGEVAALDKSVKLRLAALDIMTQMGAQLDYQAERTKILQDREIGILEIQQKRREAVRNSTEQAFDAAIAGGSGISALIRSQGLGIGRTVAGNLGVQVFSGLSGRLALPGQTNADGTPNLLGKILANTPFAADPLKTATDRNTEATNLNTAALLGKAAAGGTITGLSGLGGLAATAASITGLPSYFPTITSMAARPGVLPGYTGTSADSAVNRAVTEQLGIPTPTATSDRTGLLKAAGVAGILATAGLGAYSGFKAGGAQGALQGSSSILGGVGGTIALLAPTSGPLAPILLGAAAATGLVAALLGDPKKRRDKAIDQMVADARYNSNTSTTYDLDMFGRSIDYSLGNAPRVVIVNQNVQAWDASSFVDHADDVASAAELAFQRGHSVIQTAREAILGGNV